MLTRKQSDFVSQYLVDLNGKKAAIRAGYSPDSAAAEASRLLRNVNIRQEIDRAMDARGERTLVTADRVLAEIAKIAFAEIRSVAEWTPRGIKFKPSEDISDEDSGAIAEVSEQTKETDKSSTTTIKVKMHDKIRALHLLCQHLGILKGIDEELAALRAMSYDEVLKLAKEKIPELGST